MSKDFEKLLYIQTEIFVSNKLSTKLSDVQKNFNTQYCLTYMKKLEKKKTLDNGKHVVAVFMDLSKAFDTINHDLLTDGRSLKVFYSYFIISFHCYFTVYQIILCY